MHRRQKASLALCLSKDYEEDGGTINSKVSLRVCTGVLRDEDGDGWVEKFRPTSSNDWGGRKEAAEVP